PSRRCPLLSSDGGPPRGPPAMQRTLGARSIPPPRRLLRHRGVFHRLELDLQLLLEVAGGVRAQLAQLPADRLDFHQIEPAGVLARHVLQDHRSRPSLGVALEVRLVVLHPVVVARRVVPLDDEVARLVARDARTHRGVVPVDEVDRLQRVLETGNRSHALLLGPLQLEIEVAAEVVVAAFLTALLCPAPSWHLPSPLCLLPRGIAL